MAEEKQWTSPAISHYYPWWLKFGIPRDFWVVYEEQIGKYINANKLTPISKEGQMGIVMGSMPAPEVTTAKETKRFPIWWYGGMKVAHLHYKGNTYLLKPEQWKAFAKPILEELQSRLSRAGAVSFDKMLDVAEDVNQIV